jgi:DNA-binding transcriptional MerR regulator
MKNDIKNPEAYKTIGEIAKELDLINKKTGSLQTHTLRYWEKEFKQIKPKIMAGKRRYYSKKNFEIIKLIKFLLKDKGFTINGVKKILANTGSDMLDANVDLSVYKSDLNVIKNFKNKVKKISNLIKELKSFK